MTSNAPQDGVCYRQALRSQLKSRRASLRLPEAAFLDLVIEIGSGEEVANAHNALQNDLLFFHEDGNNEVPISGKDLDCDNDSDDGLASEKKINDEPLTSRPALVRAMGSTRRMDCLRRRSMECTAQAEIWRAHHKSTKRLASLRFSPDIPLPSDQLEEGNTEECSSEELSIAQQQQKDVHRRRSIRNTAMGMMFASIAELDTKLSEESAEESESGYPTDASIENERKFPIREEQNNYDHASSSQSSPRKRLIARNASINIYGGEGFELFDSMSSLFGLADGGSVESEGDLPYDPWNDRGSRDEEDNSPFHASDIVILGTDAHDESAKPHILSPPNMLALQPHLPFSKRGESFWLKYSLVRDGASARTFLTRMRGSKYCLLAMETLDGEVFGAFTSSNWQVSPRPFGETGDSFVWRMSEPRTHNGKVDQEAIAEQAARERNLDVFKYTHRNNAVQQCNSGRIALGGGSLPGVTPMYEASSRRAEPRMIGPHDWGFAIAFEKDYMLEATSAASVTFFNPPLSSAHADGSRFELVNLEAWTLTPCLRVEEAEVLECGHLFLKRHLTI